MVDELHVLPIDPESQKKVAHDYETAGFTGPDRGECIIEGCKAKPHTICWSCSKDTISILWLNHANVCQGIFMLQREVKVCWLDWCMSVSRRQEKTVGISSTGLDQLLTMMMESNDFDLPQTFTILFQNNFQFYLQVKVGTYIQNQWQSHHIYSLYEVIIPFTTL